MNALVSNIYPRLLAACFAAWCVACCAAICQEPAPLENKTVTVPFQGVRYICVNRPAPDPQVVHLVEIALDAPGLRFATTSSNGPDEPRETWCETTRVFVERLGAQIGINGNYFIYDQEAHTEILGLAVSDGNIVSAWDNSSYHYAVNIRKDNTVVFVQRPDGGAGTTRTEPETELFNALSGNPMLLKGGIRMVAEGGERHPRTGIGITADNKLLLFVADGRQPSYSVGMTFYEMAVVLQECGAVDALALDGGGSTTLVFADPAPRVVNVPMPAVLPVDIALGPPGIERKNGNNLAVFVSPVQADANDAPE